MEELNLIWMQGQSCDGDSMSVLDATSPDFLEFLRRNKINLLYHPTISPIFGNEAQALFNKCMSGEIPIHIFVFEGSVPLNDGYGDYVGMKDIKTVVESFAKQSMLTIAVGTCASFGGVPAAIGNETNSVGLQWKRYEFGGFLGKDYVSFLGLPVINIPGCPTHPDWVLGTIQAFRSGKGNALKLDKFNRPFDYFHEKVHRGCKHCEYLEMSIWAKDFTDVGCFASNLGCKGRTTHADCNIRLWNNVSTCTRAGAPCIGCCNPGFPDEMLPFKKETLNLPQDISQEIIDRHEINKGGK